MTPTAADSPTATPVYQSGHTSGRSDARRHLKRNFVIEDLPGLTAYASDAAARFLGRSERREQHDQIAQYVDGYVRGYREIAKL